MQATSGRLERKPWNSLRVLIISGVSLFREGLQTLLSQSSQVEVVGAVPDMPQALRDIPALHPDVVVLDCDSVREAVIDRVLSEDGVCRLVVLSLRDNHLGVYSRDEIESPNRLQLLSAVLSGAGGGGAAEAEDSS